MREPLDDYIIKAAPTHRTKLAGYIDALHVIRNNFVIYVHLSEVGKYIKGSIETAALKLLNQYETEKKVKPDEDDLTPEDEEDIQNEIEAEEERMEREGEFDVKESKINESEEEVEFTDEEQVEDLIKTILIQFNEVVKKREVRFDSWAEYIADIIADNDVLIKAAKTEEFKSSLKKNGLEKLIKYIDNSLRGIEDDLTPEDEEEQERGEVDEGIEPDFNKDGEEVKIKKLVEGVRELIGEVPGINPQDQEILQWALKNDVIYDQFPEDDVMIDALALLDMTGMEDKDIGDADDVGIKAYYLKYIMLPRAKKEYAEQNGGEEISDVELDSHEEGESGIDCDMCEEFVKEEDIKVDKFDNTVCPICKRISDILSEYGLNWEDVGEEEGEELRTAVKNDDEFRIESIINSLKHFDVHESKVDEAKIEVPDSVKTFSIISPGMGDPGGTYWELKVNGKTYKKCKDREECYTELAKYKPVEVKENGGFAKKAGNKPEDFDKDQLAVGIKVEMEHTDNKSKAQKIAMDHLIEDPKYYTKLKKMEAGACNESINDDPTKEDMLATLEEIFGLEDGFEEDAEIAMYWFANHNHGGQDSNLYSVLSTSEFKPGPNSSFESEGDGMVKMMYDTLTDKYIISPNINDVDEATEPESDFYTVNPKVVDKREADELAKNIDAIVIENPDHSFSVIKKKGSK